MNTYRYGTDQNFVALTSLSKTSFELLLRRFQANCPLFKSRNVGRKTKFRHPHQLLGLILQYYCDTIGSKNLCQIFGIPPATLSRYLKLGEWVLLQGLMKEPLAAIKWPTLLQQEEWARQVQQKMS
jgi:hypothetical protein